MNQVLLLADTFPVQKVHYYKLECNALPKSSELQRMIWSYDWSSKLCTQLKQLWNYSLKKIQAWTEFEPMTPAIPMQCSLPTELSKQVGADHLVLWHIRNPNFYCKRKQNLIRSAYHSPLRRGLTLFTKFCQLLKFVRIIQFVFRIIDSFSHQKL